MGQSKHKRAQLEHEQALWATVASRSAARAGPSDVPRVQFLFISRKHADEARQALGGLPLACERFLADSAVQDDVADVVSCCRWPEGRVDVELLKPLDEEEVLRFLGLTLGHAYAYGYSFAAAEFIGGTWTEAMAQCPDAIYTEQLQALFEDMSRIGQVRSRDMQGRLLLTLPPVTDADIPGQQALAAQVLRRIAAMTASRQSLAKSAGLMVLAFDGFDDDPREVWDIEACRGVLQTIHHAASYWPVLAEPSQYSMWLGALANSKPSESKDASERVAITLDEDKAQAVITHVAHAMASLASALDAGDGTGGVDHVFARTTQRLGAVLRGATDSLEEMLAKPRQSASSMRARAGSAEKAWGSRDDAQPTTPKASAGSSLAAGEDEDFVLDASLVRQLLSKPST